MARVTRAEARARGLQLALARELEALASAYAAEEVAALRGGVLKSRATDRGWQRILDLVRKFGARIMAGAMRFSPETLIQSAIEGREPQIKVIQEWVNDTEKRVRNMQTETRRQVREAVQRIYAEAASEVPTPSTGTIARRIRTQLTTLEGDDRVFTFSSERAALIARTETVISENTGIVAGYEATGVEEIEWLSYRDGRSGDRHHERMHGKRVALGETFELPSGARLRWPGDPSGPIGEIANCRCTTRAVKPRPARVFVNAPERKPTDKRTARMAVGGRPTGRQNAGPIDAPLPSRPPSTLKEQRKAYAMHSGQKGLEPELWVDARSDKVRESRYSTYTTEYAAKALAGVPVDVQRLLVHKEYVVEAVDLLDGDVAQRVGLRGTPRGWPPGSQWAQVDGAAIGRSALFVAHSGMRDERAAAVALHEIGHAIDHAAGLSARLPVSNSQEWIDIARKYDAKIEKWQNSGPEKRSGGYFREKTNPTGFASEFFAEFLSELYSPDKAVRDRVRRLFPEAVDLVAKRIAGAIDDLHVDELIAQKRP